MMAEAILRGLLAKDIVPPSKVWVVEPVAARREVLSKLNVSVTAEITQMLSHCKNVFIAVKPQIVPIILPQIEKCEKDLDLQGTLFISICAGVTIKSLKTGNPNRLIARVMPNQACLVGEGASAFSLSEECIEEHGQIVKTLLGACGEVVELKEGYMDAVVGVSGSGPAYAYMLIEAMSDAGLREGLPRAISRKLAAQTVLGAAKMVLESPTTHLGELRNRVESPGGTTIAATARLEKHGFRYAVIDAVAGATERSRQLGGK